MDENQTQDRRIKNVDLTSMMRSSFLDYAMETITGEDSWPIPTYGELLFGIK